jgi:hypothetical protein
MPKRPTITLFDSGRWKSDASNAQAIGCLMEESPRPDSKGNGRYSKAKLKVRVEVKRLWSPAFEKLKLFLETDVLLEEL